MDSEEQSKRYLAPSALAELKRKATAASKAAPGEWEHTGQCSVRTTPVDVPGSLLLTSVNFDEHGRYDIAEFAASACPPAVIALINEVSFLREALLKACKERDELRDAAAGERSRIVAWLREFNPEFQASMHSAANSIEHGLHSENRIDLGPDALTGTGITVDEMFGALVNEDKCKECGHTRKQHSGNDCADGCGNGQCEISDDPCCEVDDCDCGKFCGADHAG